MTDVLILKRFAGHRPGQVVPLTDYLEKHIQAGNAKLLPNEAPEHVVPESRQSYVELPTLTAVSPWREDEPDDQDDVENEDYVENDADDDTQDHSSEEDEAGY